jgi:hypothetical protein
MLKDDSGAPLAPTYAAVIAEKLDYTTVMRDNANRVSYYPRTHAVKVKGPYHPHVEATNCEFAVYQSTRMVRVYTVDHHIHAVMFGTPWDDGELFSLFDWCKKLPHSAAVVGAVITQADFLDEHPEYRGLTVKESATKARKVGVDTLEV